MRQCGMLTNSRGTVMLVAIIEGDERDKYLLRGGRELWAGATQQRAREKSTREPARKASTAAPVTGHMEVVRRRSR